MPTSAIHGKHLSVSVLLRLTSSIRFRQVHDVGAGTGVMARIVKPLLPGARWRAYEAWAPYVDDYRLRTLYDEVVIGDVRRMDWTTQPGADLACPGDVLEHMSAYHARTLVADLLERCRICLLSIPIGHWPQGAVGGNPFERHADIDWSETMIRQLFPEIAYSYIHPVAGNAGIGVFLAARSQADRWLLAAVGSQVEGLCGDPSALTSAFDFCPDWMDPSITARFHDDLHRLLGMDAVHHNGLLAHE